MSVQVKFKTLGRAIGKASFTIEEAERMLFEDIVAAYVPGGWEIPSEPFDVFVGRGGLMCFHLESWRGKTLADVLRKLEKTLEVRDLKLDRAMELEEQTYTVEWCPKMCGINYGSTTYIYITPSMRRITRSKNVTGNSL